MGKTAVPPASDARAAWTIYIATTALVAVTMSACGACGGGASTADAGQDGGSGCGTNRFISLDYQCRDHAGCQSVGTDGCGCRCSKCDFDKCVEQSCEPACPADAGTSDVTNVYLDDGSDDTHGPDDGGTVEDVFDSGHPDAYQYPCDMVLNLDASYIDRDWDAALKIQVGNYSAMRVNDTLAFFTTDSATNEKKSIDVISLATHEKVAVVTACGDPQDSFGSMKLSGEHIFWNRWRSSGRDVFGWTPLTVDRPKRLTFSNVGLLGAYQDSIVFGNIQIDGVVPETLFYLEIATDETKDTSLATEPMYGFQWEDWYIFQATYTKPEYKDCVASYDFGHGQYKEYACSNRMMITSGHSWKAAYQDWRDSSKYGHPSTDIFVYDLQAEKEIRLTEDEASQWCPYMFKNLVVYKDLTESGVKAEGPEGIGGLWVYDLDTGVKRKVPIEPMDGCPLGVGDRYVVYNEGAYGNTPTYLIDLVNAGVVKDGHVVPE
ncbi:MAG: hypothetical protein HY897_18950 [Deltaproteobacteria bacterium]|nr:hypothetical protein [Deltaproteobacteria bacterium]